MGLKFLSLNRKGLNSPFKRKALHREATQTKTDVIFAQETHLRDKDPISFTLPNFPHLTQANAPTKKRGVFVAIRNTLFFQEILVITDPAGRYVILECLLNIIAFPLVNIYAPNVGQVRFLKKVLAKTEEIKKGHLLNGGYFNMVCDPNADSTASRRYQPGSLKQFLT